MAIPCGCAPCGCMCADHSPSGEPEPCKPHLGAALALVGYEAMRLVTVALFAATVIAWAAILAER